MVARESAHLCRSESNWDWMIPCQLIYAGAPKAILKAKIKNLKL
jgi:hypothetical protein